MATLVIIAPNKSNISGMWHTVLDVDEYGTWTEGEKIQRGKKVYITIDGSLKDLLKIRTHLLEEGYEVGALKVNGEIRKKPAKSKKRRHS